MGTRGRAPPRAGEEAGRCDMARVGQHLRWQVVSATKKGGNPPPTWNSPDCMRTVAEYSVSGMPRFSLVMSISFNSNSLTLSCSAAGAGGWVGLALVWVGGV